MCLTCFSRTLRLAVAVFRLWWRLTRWVFYRPLWIIFKMWGALNRLFGRNGNGIGGEKIAKSTLQVLQRQVLVVYFASDDYCTNPYETFGPEVYCHGFHSFEDFLEKIPLEMIDYCTSEGHQVYHQGFNCQPVKKAGMRFVVLKEPELRGVLGKDKIIVLEGPSEKLICKLKMDNNNHSKGFLRSILDFCLYSFPIRLLLEFPLFPKLFQLENSLQEYFMHELQLEKDYLRRFLQYSPQKHATSFNPTTENSNTGNFKHPSNSTFSPAADPPPLRPVYNFYPSQNLSSENFEMNGRTGPLSLSSSSSTLESQTSEQTHRSKSQTSPSTFSLAPELSFQNDNLQINNYNEREDSMMIKVASGKKLKSSTTPRRLSPPPLGNQQLSFATAEFLGKRKGIDGAHNSCYMDALLFSMFYTSTIFDGLLERKEEDTEDAELTRKILKEKIVQPLKTSFYCSSDNVWALRQHLSKAADEDLVLGSFMDVEELLYLLLQNVLQERDFMRYVMEGEEDVWSDMMHLMRVDNIDPSEFIDVQRNLKMSFDMGDKMKLASVPTPAFFVGMPRSNRQLVHYEAVIPNLELRISHLMTSEVCSKCGENEAAWEEEFHEESNISRFCSHCITKEREGSKIVSRDVMKLMAVICIYGVHFTAFVRWDEDERQSKWLYFDSMAGGYPEVEEVPHFEHWMKRLESDHGLIKRQVQYGHKGKSKKRKQKEERPPARVERACRDGHICIYEPVYWK